MTAGYSGKPLIAKLGWRPGQQALLIGAEQGPAELLAFDGFSRRDLWPGLASPSESAGPFDVIHVFERDRDALAAGLPGLRARLAPAGMIWVSWPKKAARLPTTLTEDVIRGLALARGLVDVKVCAVDATWSGLKLVIPLALR